MSQIKPDESTDDDRTPRELLEAVAATDGRSAKWAERMLANLDDREARDD